MTAVAIRDDYLGTLNHIAIVFPKLIANRGKGHVFTFPDVHKLTEGLFLSAWTYWEGFLRALISYDLGADANGILRRDVRQFRYVSSSQRLADRILNHPDHPERFVEWSEYSSVVKRANEFLGVGHRFISPIPQNDDLARLRRIRNAIAHRSDKAWASFRALVRAAPFGLSANQLQGITPGRFLSSHQWNGAPVIETSLDVLRAAAHTLVP